MASEVEEDEAAAAPAVSALVTELIRDASFKEAASFLKTEKKVGGGDEHLPFFPEPGGTSVKGGSLSRLFLMLCTEAAVAARGRRERDSIAAGLRNVGTTTTEKDENDEKDHRSFCLSVVPLSASERYGDFAKAAAPSPCVAHTIVSALPLLVSNSQFLALIESVALVRACALDSFALDNEVGGVLKAAVPMFLCSTGREHATASAAGAVLRLWLPFLSQGESWVGTHSLVSRIERVAKLLDLVEAEEKSSLNGLGVQEGMKHEHGQEQDPWVAFEKAATRGPPVGRNEAAARRRYRLVT